MSPDFKILLYPLSQGDPLPESSWNEDRTELTIKSPTETRRFAVSSGPEQRTLLTLKK